jgi:hypothetical protein
MARIVMLCDPLKLERCDVFVSSLLEALYDAQRRRAFIFYARKHI